MQPGPLASRMLSSEFWGKKAQDLASVQSMQPTSQTAAPLAVTITGTVKGENNESLPGVNVLLKGSTTGTATNAEGRYSLTAPDGNGTLVFSFIGYLTQEVPINNRSEIDVTLQTDTKALSEVVVVGYGTQQKKTSPVLLLP